MRGIVCILLFFLTINYYSYSQVNSSVYSDSIKIGLALSGGTAHGLAHIGVLKYLEEQNIRIDYITGTSMGSIIGALYAAGISADSLISIALKTNWNKIIFNEEQLKLLVPLEKPFFDLFKFKITYKENQLHLPISLLGDFQLNLLLNRILLPYFKVRDFDELKIPFRCVAANIENGQKKVFKSGALYDALRASMAIPFVFKPHEIDKVLYVDGGLVDNFPVVENKNMGADLVIGIDVGYELLNKDQISNSFDVLIQSAFMSVNKTSKEQYKDADILIKPKLAKYSSFEFDAAKYFIDQGYKAANLMDLQFEKYGLKNTRKDRPNAKNKTDKKYYIQKISTNQNNGAYRELIESKIDLSIEDKLSAADIEKKVIQLYGTNMFENVSYSINEDHDGKLVLDINVIPYKEIEFGAGFNHFSSTNTSLIGFINAKNILGELSVLRFTTRLSDNSGVQLDYTKRITKNRIYFLRLLLNHERKELYLQENNRLNQQFKRSLSSFKINIGKEFNSSLFRFGLSFNSEFLNTLFIKPIDINRYFKLDWRADFEYLHNSLDRLVLPRSGKYFMLNGNYSIKGNYKVRYLNDLSREQLAISEANNMLQMSAYFKLPISLLSNYYLNIFGGAGYKTSASLANNFYFGGTKFASNNVIPFIGREEMTLILDEYSYIASSVNFDYSNSITFSALTDFVIGKKAFVPFLSAISNNETYQKFFGVGLSISWFSPIGPIIWNIGYRENGFLRSEISISHKFIN